MPQPTAANRLPFWGGLALCALAGALHMADTALFVDAATGFAAQGPALARCAMWALAAALLWLLGRGAAACPQRQPGNTVLLAAALRLAGAALTVLACVRFAAAGLLVTGPLAYYSGAKDLALVLALLAQPGVPGLLAEGLLALLAAAWLLVLGPKALTGAGPLPLAVPGFLLLLWPFWLALQRFLVDPASVDRLPVTLRVVSTAALLLFAAALLRAVYVPAMPGGQRLFRTGMLCFLFGTCLELPQTLFELAHGSADLGTVLTAAALALFGLCGLAAAWLATGPALPVPAAPLKGSGAKGA